MAPPKIDQETLQAFIDDKVNLQPDNLDKYRGQVKRLRKELEDHINQNPEFSLKKMLLSGSLAKGSALSNLNDIDVAVYMVAEENLSEKQMIDWLYQRLLEAYPNLNKDQIKPWDHSVRIEFRGTGLDVECVPILSRSPDNDWGYVYSKDTGEKTLTNIPLQINFLQKRKEKQPNDFIQSIRLIKWWIRMQKDKNPEFRFKSMMVELICSKLLAANVDFSDSALALESFFEYLISDQLKSRVYFEDHYAKTKLPSESTGAIEIFDPVNPINNVASTYTETNRAQIVSAAQEAYDAITWARNLPTKAEAIAQWQLVLGSSFRG